MLSPAGGKHSPGQETNMEQDQPNRTGQDRTGRQTDHQTGLTNHNDQAQDRAHSENNREGNEESNEEKQAEQMN